MANKIKIKIESGEIEVDRDVIEAALKEADEPRVWKPEVGEKSFYLDSVGDAVYEEGWSGDSIDHRRYARGRIFPTREAAEEDRRSGLDAYCVAYTTVKNWLPPGYGRQAYDEMTVEAQTIIDSFQGKDAYQKVCLESDFYLNDGDDTKLLSDDHSTGDNG